MELTGSKSARTVAPLEARIPPSGDPARPKSETEIEIQIQMIVGPTLFFSETRESTIGPRDLSVYCRRKALMNLETRWTVYRTRFLVRAQQLTEPLVFTDALGREQSGQPGDYLVETSEGIKRITTRALFEDIYVPLFQNMQIENGRGALAQPASRNAPENSARAIA